MMPSLPDIEAKRYKMLEYCLEMASTEILGRARQRPDCHMAMIKLDIFSSLTRSPTPVDLERDEGFCVINLTDSGIGYLEASKWMSLSDLTHLRPRNPPRRSPG
jgi:hypothetical protein